MEDTSTDSLKCTHYSTILKVRTYGNCFPCECFCYKNKVHEIEQVFFIIYVICQWYSKLTKFIKINNTWFIPVRGCVILSSSCPVFYFHCFFSHWLVTTSTKMITAKRKVKYSDHSNRCWVNTVEQQVRCFWCVPELTRCFGAVRTQSPSAVDTAVRTLGREERTLQAEKRISQKGRHVYLYSCSRNQSLVST